MKVIIDVLTPKQVMLFPKLANRLRKKGYETLLTSRRYREASQLLDKYGIETAVVGEHGGRGLKHKLLASSGRTMELVGVFEGFCPNVAVSFSSPEMARVSFGLGVPHVCMNDSPHATAVARLTIPLSCKVLTPWVIPVESWTVYGIAKQDVVRYHCLDPWVWLKGFEPDIGILEELGLDDEVPIVTFRPPEIYAAYLNKPFQNSVNDFVNRLLLERSNIQVVMIPRYAEQLKEIDDALGDSIVLCESVVDGPSLLAFSDVFVGMGGTMTTEAALLGVPTFSCYPEEYAIEGFLIERGLIVKETNPCKLVEKVSTVLDDIKSAKKIRQRRAKELTTNFVDPIDIIISEIDKIPVKD